MANYRSELYRARVGQRQEHADLTHGTIPLPDLRFEKTYTKSIRPYVHLDSPASRADSSLDQARATLLASGAEGEVITIEWGKVIWITLRDQVISPFLQGAVL